MELRGPVGGYFVWGPSAAVRFCSSPAVRGRAVAGDAEAPPDEPAATVPVGFLYSARSLEEVIYRSRA